MVIAAGCAFFAGGTLWWHEAIKLRPDYLRDVLPGMLLTGTGVGLALPTLFAAASASLPAARFATGSAVINMARQICFVIGVAVLVAILGTPATAAGRLGAYQHGWLAISAISLAAGLAALSLGLTPFWMRQSALRIPN
jgi:hypothetical protein